MTFTQTHEVHTALTNITVRYVCNIVSNRFDAQVQMKA